MLTPEAIIDSIQNTKRVFTDTVITEPSFNTAAHAYIDAQTAFAKMLVKNSFTIIQSSMDACNKSWFPTKAVTA